MPTNTLSDRQLRFVQKPRIARLATTRPDGAPHIAPVWFRYEDGEFLVLTDRGSQKHCNVLADARAVLCIDDERPPYHTVLVRGRARIEDEPGPAWRLALAVHYLGEDGGLRYIEQSGNTDGVLLRIVPESITGW
ncbi:MAG TPA: PPOX class F420-dependent oxidoreductase [Dehalococcoidia bacterium]|nr:PPOX class F420-dependent oxidoreductase [Dehalococcoidia bacterium]